MSVVVNEELVEQLKDVGSKLLQPPSSTPELVNLLDEVVLLLSKIGQSPAKVVQEALLPTMKGLISDKLMGSSDADVLTTLAACLNEIMRISAPVAPYDDDKMRQIFELIVSSFDNLSCSRGRCYSKAVLILQSVARLRSCVMMLDLDCDSLITKMFQLFQKHISSDHPHCVFLAMEKIMSVMVEESDSLSMELVMVLVESIRKENQNASPEAFKLGAKVVEDCSKKLRPYIMEAMTSLDCCLEDYAPILSLICETESNAVEDLVHDSPKHLANSDPTADELHSAENVQHLKTIEGCSHDPGTDLGTASKSGGKVKSHNSDEENQNSTSKEKTARGIPHGHVKNLLVPKSEKAVPTLEDEVSKGETEEVVDLDNKKVRQATSHGGSSDKKGKPSKKDVSGGTGKKGTTGLSKKNKIRTNDTSKSQRKRTSSDDDP